METAFQASRFHRKLRSGQRGIFASVSSCGLQKDSELVRDYPDLLNTSVAPHLRVHHCRKPAAVVVERASSNSLTGSQQLKEDFTQLTSPITSNFYSPHHIVDTEPFPEYTEPLLATLEEMEDIIDMRVRQPANKPAMRVTPADLRGTGVLAQLPEFMSQLAAANLKDQQGCSEETVELDEDQARDTIHVEMDIVAGVLEEKKAPIAGGGADDSDTEGDGDSHDEDFQLNIPPAGTMPTASASSSTRDKAKAVPLVRPLSSGSNNSEFSPPSSTTSSPKIRINVNNIRKPTAQTKEPVTPSTHELKETPAAATAVSPRTMSNNDSSPSPSNASSASLPTSESSGSTPSSTSSVRCRRLIIHTPASRERAARQQQQGLQQSSAASREESETSSSGTSSGEEEEEDEEGSDDSDEEESSGEDDDDEGKMQIQVSIPRLHLNLGRLFFPTVGRSNGVNERSSPPSSSSSSSSPSPPSSPRTKRARSPSTGLGDLLPPPVKKTKALIEEVE